MIDDPLKWGRLQGTPSYDQRHENELQKLYQWEIEGTSGNQKIRNRMEIEDKHFHLGSRWLPEQSNWENNAKGGKFQGGTELSEHVGKYA